MDRWYKDRDFPEVKASNADIVAVIENPKQLERVIKDQNDLIDQIEELLSLVSYVANAFNDDQELEANLRCYVYIDKLKNPQNYCKDNK